MSRTRSDETVVVSDLESALPIATEATTSRSVVDNDRVRVVAFTFDAGEELTEHTAAMPVVVLVTSGRVRFDVAGGTHELGPGDTVYLPPREPHSLVALDPARLTLVMARDGS